MLFSKICEVTSNNVCIACADTNQLTDVAFIENGQTVFSKNTLYFGTLEQAKNLTCFPQSCFLSCDSSFVIDAQMNSRSPMDYLTSHIADLALVNSENLFSVFNAAKRSIESNRGDELYEQLIQTAKTSQDIHAVVDQASICLGNPLIFIDDSFKIIASSTTIPVVDPIWKKNLEQGYCDYDFIRAVRSIDSVKNQPMNDNAIEVTCHASPYRKLSCRILLQGRCIGHVLTFATQTDFVPATGEMLRIISQAIGTAIQMNACDIIEDQAAIEKTFYNLVIGANKEDLEPALSNLSFPKNCMVLCVQPNVFISKSDFTNHLNRRYRDLFPGLWLTMHRNMVLALVDIDRQYTDENRASFRDIIEKEGLKVGVSSIYSDIYKTREHYQEAVFALEYGQKLSPDADTNLYRYEDYRFYALLGQVPKDADLTAYCHPLLSKLSLYDYEHDMSLYDTLKAYLACNCNAKLTAASLYIHRNTLSYRLQRIIELGEIDLEDEKLRFLLRMSYMICDFQKAQHQAG